MQDVAEFILPIITNLPFFLYAVFFFCGKYLPISVAALTLSFLK